MKYASVKLWKDRLVSPPQHPPKTATGAIDLYTTTAYDLEDAEGRKVRITHKETGKTMFVHETAVERFDPLPEPQAAKGGKR